MNETKSETEDLRYNLRYRRSFLKGAAVTTAAVTSGALAGDALAAQTEAESAPIATPGYQETAHIKEYYRLARF